MLKSLRLPCRRTACTTLERWGEWREEGELTLKVANSTQKAYHGPNWLRILHVTDEKDSVCARKTKISFFLAEHWQRKLLHP